MASLIGERFVREIAFGYSGSHDRVFECDSMIVSAEYDVESWVSGDNKRKIYKSGLYLTFSLNFRYLRRISPTSSFTNDIVDIINRLYDGTNTVYIKPVYDLIPSISHTVVPRQDNIELVHVKRFRNIPEYNIELITIDRLDDLPNWLDNTTLK